MIYSIGHGNKDIRRFIEELKAFNVQFLIDVRTKPYSKFWPHFDRERLKTSLLNNSVKYLFLGDKLGGLPDDPSCYRDGLVDYDRLKSSTQFLNGIDRLVTADQKELNVAVMCSESKPEECHRSKAIGEVLAERNIVMVHILSEDSSKDQGTVMNELTGGKAGTDLFGNEPSFTSRKKYR